LVGWVNIRRLNIIDEDKLFELDYDNHKITNKFIGNAHLVTIDNFFKNPDMVRDYVFTVPLTKNKGVTGNFPGLRTRFRSPEGSKLHDFYNQTIFNEFKETTYKINLRNINLQAIRSDFGDEFQGLDLNNKSFWPHTDSLPWQDPFRFQQLFASSVWLNTPEECTGGTSFWRNNVVESQSFLSKKAITHKLWEKFKSHSSFTNEFIDWETKWSSYEFDSITDKYWYDRLLKRFEDSKRVSSPLLTNKEKPEKTFWLESNESWELLDVAEMKYNRMTLYQGIYFHSQYVEKDSFVDYPRISFQIFF